MLPHDGSHLPYPVQKLLWGFLVRLRILTEVVERAFSTHTLSTGMPINSDIKKARRVILEVHVWLVSVAPLYSVGWPAYLSNDGGYSGIAGFRGELDHVGDWCGCCRRQQPLVCASGLSPSGPIHLGNLREVMTPHLVADEIRRRGRDCRHLLSWDDYDRFRRVPSPRGTTRFRRGCLALNARSWN